MDIAINVNNIKIETPRLVLRAHNKNDVEDIFEYAKVDGVGEMAAWKHHKSLEDSQIMLEKFMSEKKVFAIVYKEDNKVIGYLGLHTSWAEKDEKYNSLLLKEIVYVLNKDYWGKGIMPEAVNEVIKYCFNTLNLDGVTCGHFTYNAKSKRVIEKSGFTFVNTSMYYARQFDKEIENSNYILLKKTFSV